MRDDEPTGDPTRAEPLARSVFEAAREPLLILDAGLRVRAANPAFYRAFHTQPAETVGRPLHELGAGRWDVPALRALLEQVIPRDSAFEDFEVAHAFEGVGPKVMLLNARRINPAGGQGHVLLAIEDVTAARQAAAEAARLRADLEERVRSRTAELEAANKELEAFAYSVSHDLRSPLRAVDGFSRILLEDFGPALPAEVQEYLRDVRANAQRMGRLIDDLLRFSRLGRQPLHRRPADPAALVADALRELAADRVGRPVEVTVGPLPPCQADPGLLRQVWVNLLSNALKYTRKRPDARVEVGGWVEAGAPVYWVKDNGVGFDMRHADKLFGVFQRLHRDADYEGTGAGLAIVQRVVHRHGGRVWAEAEKGRGAAFYFSIPPVEDAQG